MTKSLSHEDLGPNYELEIGGMHSSSKGFKPRISRIWGAHAALAAVATVALLVLISGCGGGDSSSSSASTSENGAESFYTGGTPNGSPETGGTVTVNSNEPPTHLDPVAVNTPGEDRPSEAMFDTLAEFMPGGDEPEPALASSWDVSKDDSTYTFHIREGVKFANGEPLTGEDVLYSMERQKNLSISSTASYAEHWEKVSLLDPMTVQIKLDEPSPILIEELTLPAFAIVPKNVVENESEESFASHPIGTGPFMLTSASAGNQKLVMVRNPHYWQAKKPYVEKLVFNVVENDNSRILSVRSGGATIATNIPYAQVGALEGTDGVRMLVQPLWGTGLNPFNDTKPPLNSVEARRALLYATPFEEIIDAVYKGLGTAPNSVWGQIKFWDSKVPTYPYDLDKAKALLEKSPTPDGFDLTVEVQGGESTGELLATILQSAWAEIGVHVSIHTVDYATIFEDFLSGNYEMQVFPPEAFVNEMPDPQVPALAYLGGEQFPGVAPSPTMKRSIEAAVAATDMGTRGKAFEKLQEESYWKEPGYLAIANLTTRNLVDESLRGFSVLPNGHVRWEDLWLAH